MLDWPRKGEQLFVSSRLDWENNGCITRQSYVSVASAYLECADSLVLAAIEHNTLYVDVALYPAVFLYRQYFELMLKEIVWTLRLLERGDNQKPPRGHDLRQLWEEAKKLAQQHYGDDYPAEFSYLDGCIAEFDTHDKGGDAFRYPYLRDWSVPFPDLRHINLRHLYETMSRISNFFGGMSDQLNERWVYTRSHQE